MNTLENLPLGKKLKTMFGMFICVFGLGAFVFYGVIPPENRESSIIIAGVLFWVVGLYLTVTGITGKERLSYDKYSELKEIKLFTSLNNKRLRYKDDLVNSEESVRYNVLCDKYPELYNNYAVEVLNMPPIYSKPVSATTAAAIGSSIGGLAVGIAAAADAERNRIAFEKNVREVEEAKLAVGTAHSKLQYCYNEMVKIIKKNPRARSDWEFEEKLVESGIREKYKVRSR